MTNPLTWWHNAVVYQIYPRSFADSNGDGIGDLPGITSRVDHLARLGVDVVWLSPIYRSPQDDNGYDISDYYAVDPIFGTMSDLDELIAALHEQNIKLMMDLVVNHTSDEHPWFIESRDPKSPKRDWYIWRPPGEKRELGPGWRGDEPTPMPSAFSGPAWHFDEGSGEFYLHLFSRKQPDMNWENPEVRRAIHQMMRWWLDRGVDGFRMDVINLISKPDSFYLPETFYNPDAGGWPSVGPRFHEFMAEMHKEVFDARPGRNFITVGECPAITPEEALATTDPARRELDMVFQFEHVNLEQGPSKFDRSPVDALALRKPLARWQDALARAGWNSLYLSNHDQARPISRWGDDQQYWSASAMALAGMSHAHRGTPYVYQGEELGMTNYPFTSLDQFEDLESVNFINAQLAAGRRGEEMLPGVARYSRDNARTPVQWDDSPSAGFTTGTPWLAANPNHTWLNAAAQVGVNGSVFEFYRRLIELRHQLPCLALGDFTLRFADDQHFWWVERHLDGQPGLVAVANCSTDEVPPPDRLPAGEVLLHNLGNDAALNLESFAPWQFVLVQRA